MTTYRRFIELFTRDRRPSGPPAKPGRWYGSYNTDWHAAHPGMWQKGEAQSGSFYAGGVWAGSTLDWDREWFAAHGMSMPRKCAYRLDAVQGVRVGSLGPGESVVIQVENPLGARDATAGGAE